MNTAFLAGNWKSYKTAADAETWVKGMAELWKQAPAPSTATIVIAAPFTLLFPLRWYLGQNNLPFQLAGQNVSAYPDGAYTGEVSAHMLKDVADWVLIGHSERRKYFGETDATLAEKVKQAKAAGLKVIYCVQNAETAVPDAVEVVAYEPTWAIGTGKADTPENAGSVVSTIKSRHNIATVLYGGSVTADNVSTYLAAGIINGVLPGGASLDPQKFYPLITHATA